MRIVVFCHSLLSDWNHGNAHFLRGLVTELGARGHRVDVYEPRDAWSLANLVADHGEGPVERFRRAYPGLEPVRYGPGGPDLDAALDGADAVLVHEWNDPDLVRKVGEHRARAARPYALFFHDTHHRSVSDPAAMGRYDLSHYDAVLAFGATVRRVYLERGWAARAFVWHEAADPRVFYPRPAPAGPAGDLVWVGNWGDDERTDELREFLLGPARELGLRAKVYGVRYPAHALDELARAGIEYGGYLPNFEAPEAFARHRLTVHVPRRYYARALPGVPTIRPFEALACGIALVSAPWTDGENLFSPGEDFVVAADGAQMRRELARLLADGAARERLAARGLRAVRARHTVAHRADELLGFVRAVRAPADPVPSPVPREATP
jgi:spore maturation protein CgeB